MIDEINSFQDFSLVTKCFQICQFLSIKGVIIHNTSTTICKLCKLRKEPKYEQTVN